MATKGSCKRSTLLKNAPIKFCRTFCQEMDQDKLWMDIVENFTRNDEVVFKPRDIRVINEQVNYGRSCTGAMFDTLSQLNFTIDDIIKALEMARIYRVAKILTNDFLGEIYQLPEFVAGKEISDEIYDNNTRYEDRTTLLLTGRAFVSQNYNNINEDIEDKEYLSKRQSGGIIPKEKGKLDCVPGRGDNNAETLSPRTEANIVSTDDNASLKQAPDLQCYFAAFSKDDHVACSMPYFVLESATSDFARTQYADGGRLLGQGGFGEVYLAKTPCGLFAVKRLKEAAVTIDVQQQFNTELETMSNYRHENLLPLLAFSSDGPCLCLVYPYMSGGSYEQALAALGNTKPLTISQRILIVQQTAAALVYLHTAKEKPLVHRDVKSANILLDDMKNARLGDFGLIRPGPAGDGTTQLFTGMIIGSSAYLAPEAAFGDVSTKLDTYSYGVVLLETLTALPAYDVNREDADLISHVEEHDDINEILDQSGGTWSQPLVTATINITNKCFQKKKSRPTMKEILPEIESLYALLS